MCFSASASLIASLTLLTVGILAVKKAPTRKIKPFAAIPLLFSAQQAAEVLVWIAQPGTWLYQLGVSGFLFFAFVIWPIWIPVSLFLLEPNDLRKKLLRILSIFGTGWALLLLLIIIIYQPDANVSCHIAYQFTTLPLFIPRWLALGLYSIPTMLPFLVTSKKIISIFGVIALLFLAITVFFWQEFLTSVWCFFAAMLSIFVVMILQALPHNVVSRSR